MAVKVKSNKEKKRLAHFGRRWRWFGHAGHFICANQCRFHLHTHVGPGGKWCVSTVGDMWKNDPYSSEYKTIGSNRKFETMVFDWEANDAADLDFLPYNDADSADKGHMKLCRKWDKIKKHKSSY